MNKKNYKLGNVLETASMKFKIGKVWTLNLFFVWMASEP